MLPRTLEPEVMDTVEEAVDYDSMDHSKVNRVFVDDLLRFAGSEPIDLGNTFDAGTGTALIPIELCQRETVSCVVVAADAAREMLKLAEQNIGNANLADKISTLLCDCKALTKQDNSFETVISNSIVHHIPTPLDSLREMVRILKPGGILFVRDLMRPSNEQAVEHLVNTYAGDANSHQQRMFRESLHAALTVEEMQGLLSELGLPSNCVSATTDRHWTVATRL